MEVESLHRPSIEQVQLLHAWSCEESSYQYKYKNKTLLTKGKNSKREIKRETETYPRMVRQMILAGARKWIGPWEGLVFIRLRRNLMYFIFWRTRPPDIQISSHRTNTTFCPFRSSFATIDANRPSMWWRASTTTRFAQIPEPDTIFNLSLCFSAAQGFRNETEREARVFIIYNWVHHNWEERTATILSLLVGPNCLSRPNINFFVKVFGFNKIPVLDGVYLAEIISFIFVIYFRLKCTV